MSTRDRANRVFRLFDRLGGLQGSLFIKATQKNGAGGLSRARCELLMEIQAAGGRLQVQDVAERTGRTKSAAGELIAKLCRDGYVFKLRVAGDGRGVWVVLSGKGRRAAAIFFRIATDLDLVVRGVVTENDIQCLEKIVRRFEKILTRGSRS